MATPTVPLKELLPPYMSHAAWQDLADAIDQVFGAQVSPLINSLAKMRYKYIFDDEVDTLTQTPHPVQAKIKSRDMISVSLYDRYDSITERLRLNQLGLRVLDPSILDDAAVNRLVQHIGSFWYVKGLDSFLDFICYMLNTTVSFANLWTKDYVSFFPEGDPAIGTPKWAGGEWYPTTHIRIDISESGISGVQLKNFARLFYDIANYNLVLEAIEQNEWNFILPNSQKSGSYPVDGPNTVPVPAHIVGIANFTERIDYINSQGSI